MAKMGQKLTPAQVEELIRRRVSGETEKKTCEEMGVSKSTYHFYARSSGRQSSAVPESGVVSFNSKGDEASGEYVTATVPTEQTLEGVLRECGADLTTWQVKEWSYRAWTTGMKVKGPGGEGTAYSKQYSIFVKFARLVPKPVRDAAEILWGRFRDAAKPKPLPKQVKRRDPLLGLVCLFDHHFGKLAWGDETGSNYDLKIAETVWQNAVDDLLERSEGRRVERWVLPVGNDLIHIDGPDNKTRNGTPQDTDGRYPKIIAAAASSVQYAVERLAESARVDVMWVPGNHDATSSFGIAHYLSGVFARHKGVTVDVSPSPRKYVVWNGVLLGFTHGNEEKIADLPTIMATEMKTKGWANSAVADWYLGHVHHAQQFMTKAVGEHKGVTIRTMRSLAAADSWHHKRGYVGAVRSAEAHFYTPTHWDSCVSVLAREVR